MTTDLLRTADQWEGWALRVQSWWQKLNTLGQDVGTEVTSMQGRDLPAGRNRRSNADALAASARLATVVAALGRTFESSRQGVLLNPRALKDNLETVREGLAAEREALHVELRRRGEGGRPSQTVRRAYDQVKSVLDEMDQCTSDLTPRKIKQRCSCCRITTYLVMCVGTIAGIVLGYPVLREKLAGPSQ